MLEIRWTVEITRLIFAEMVKFFTNLTAAGISFDMTFVMAVC